MFDGSQLFWYKLVFMTELLVSEILFVARLKRRRCFCSLTIETMHLSMK